MTDKDYIEKEKHTSIFNKSLCIEQREKEKVQRFLGEVFREKNTYPNSVYFHFT